ncbi:sigma-E processing peptidase SpoIIGA [Peribacillus acanthi]|uniref:sigma-E processing peptidase SpoIIGA n=1 Tax=Peribacillus acanthi TaxID=2171554 RepID=UPI001300703C|nr:sigma-E processing peptidase SpoIIGA [Peribacillus acanthi]
MYVDLIWTLNVLFDCLLLYWTSILLKKPIKKTRIMIGGLIGSIIIVLMFSPYYAFANSVLVKILFSILMILVTFGFTRIKNFVKQLMMFYMVTFLSGGILLGVHFLFQYELNVSHAAMLYGPKTFGDPISWMFVCIGFPIGWHFSKKNLENLEMTSIVYDQMVKVIVKIKDFESEWVGLIDSGNQLYDPISGSPVMIISISNMGDDLPQPLKTLMDRQEEILTEGKFIETDWSERIRLIPCKVVGNDHGMLLGLRPDWIKIVKGEHQYRVQKGLISFTLQELSSDRSYEAIVHPHMLTGVSEKSAS